MAKAAPNSSSVFIVTHRHGPRSLLPSSRGNQPSPAEVLERDRERVRAIHRKIVSAPRASNKSVSMPARQGWYLGSGNYVMSLGLGTPARSLTVEIDSGSDLSWVQRKPCEDCYRQQDPLFDPARSSTFSAVHCSAEVCRGLASSHTCSSGNTCRFTYEYADQSQTSGYLGRDTLTLGPSDANKLPGFVFGCADADRGLFGKIDRLVGLSRAKVSLASQATARYGVGFSYCLPSSPTATGYLSLGTTTTFSAPPPANTRFTAMEAHDDTPSLYYVHLAGVKVTGGEALDIAPAPAPAPAPAVYPTSGTIIDSGTVITRLRPRAYAKLRSAFRRAMARYRRAPALAALDTCYDFTGHTTVRVPAVALVSSNGTTLSLPAANVLYVSSVAQMCLTFAPIEKGQAVGILANTQQKTLAVVYDVANKRIGFGANGCG